MAKISIAAFEQKVLKLRRYELSFVATLMISSMIMTMIGLPAPEPALPSGLRIESGPALESML